MSRLEKNTTTLITRPTNINISINPRKDWRYGIGYVHRKSRNKYIAKENIKRMSIKLLCGTPDWSDSCPDQIRDNLVL